MMLRGDTCCMPCVCVCVYARVVYTTGQATARAARRQQPTGQGHSTQQVRKSDGALNKVNGGRHGQRQQPFACCSPGTWCCFACRTVCRPGVVSNIIHKLVTEKASAVSYHSTQHHKVRRNAFLAHNAPAGPCAFSYQAITVARRLLVPAGADHSWGSRHACCHVGCGVSTSTLAVPGT